MTKTNVMTKAWKIAKAAVIKFGGSARQYLAEALKQAWKDARKPRYTVYELETNKSSKSWVAAIVGKDPVYKLKRQFESYTKDSWGDQIYTLEDGVYEICRKGRRNFARLVGGEWEGLEASEVMAMFY